MKKLLLLSVLGLWFSACQDCGDCPEPPQELRFQLVDGIGRDKTTLERNFIDAATVSVTYIDNEQSYDVYMELDQNIAGTTVFTIPNASKLFLRNHKKLLLHIGDAIPDTLKPQVAFIETYCCEYAVYSHLILNTDTLPRSSVIDFTFTIKK